MSEQKNFVPFSSNNSNLEFTVRALIIGLVMSVVLGAANAYLGLKAGMTIAATYPAAVIGMALLKVFKGSILEENFARTVGSIGESVAAGAIFTVPAFYIFYQHSQKLGLPVQNHFEYFTVTAILISGGILGIMFVALLRKVMVDDVELPFPESKAAAQIHIAGRTGANSSKFLFGAMGLGAVIKLLAEFKIFAAGWEKFITFSKQIVTGTKFSGEGGLLLGSPKISPAYVAVGYIIGPKLASLNFSGGLIAWGLLTPIILYFLGSSIDIQAIVHGMMQTDPTLSIDMATDKAWMGLAVSVWRYIVRPIAIGGMLVGAAFTMFKMRNSLFAGLSRSISDVKKAATGKNANVPAHDKDLSFNVIMMGILGVALSTFLISKFLFSTTFLVAFVAATVMIILAFLFAAVSGYLVGIIGSSNNPISGLTLTALVVTALVMVVLGVKGQEGVAAVLGVAAIVCVSAAVAGEMLQDLKAGHILGGTPWKMQIGDIIGVVASGAIMFGVLVFLNEGDIAKGLKDGYEGGFGSREVPAPQANLMAMLSQGIVGGQMAWPLIIVGMFMGVAFILMQVKSPMLVSVGMYLPLETTFAIFTGGLIKGVVDMICEKRKMSEAQLKRVDNYGVLIASGLIAGEALMGLGFAGFAVFEKFPVAVFKEPSYLLGLVVLGFVAYTLITIPIKKAGKVEEDNATIG